MPTHRGPVFGGQARAFSLTACLALFPMHVAASPYRAVWIRLATTTWCKDNRRGHGWSRTLGCLERRHSGVFQAAGRRDRILILLLWQNGTKGEKTKIVGVHVFVCTCLTCASCCDWFVCTDINVIWVTWVLRERHNAREASSILSFVGSIFSIMSDNSISCFFVPLKHAC